MAEHSEQNRDQSHERSQAQRQFQDPLADCIPFKQMVELQEHHGFRKRIEEHRERPVERRTGDIGQKRRAERIQEDKQCRDHHDPHDLFILGLCKDDQQDQSAPAEDVQHDFQPAGMDEQIVPGIPYFREVLEIIGIGSCCPWLGNAQIQRETGSGSRNDAEENQISVIEQPFFAKRDPSAERLAIAEEQKCQIEQEQDPGPCF